MQEFHQQLFNISSDSLRQEIKKITGLEICEAAKDKATAAVQVFSTGTIVQVFLLALACLRIVGTEIEVIARGYLPVLGERAVRPSATGGVANERRRG